MIIVTLVSGKEFKYKGAINLATDNNFLYISSYHIIEGQWDLKKCDGVWLDEIVSIKGVDDEPKVLSL